MTPSRLAPGEVGAVEARRLQLGAPQVEPRQVEAVEAPAGEIDEPVGSASASAASISARVMSALVKSSDLRSRYRSMSCARGAMHMAQASMVAGSITFVQQRTSLRTSAGGRHWQHTADQMSCARLPAPGTAYHARHLASHDCKWATSIAVAATRIVRDVALRSGRTYPSCRARMGGARLPNPIGASIPWSGRNGPDAWSARSSRAGRTLRRRRGARCRAPANDYPTVARADYVFGCMQVNGQTRDALERCSCSIDVIAALLPYEQYEEAETVMRVRQRGGKNAVDVPEHADAAGEGRRPEARAGRGGTALLLTPNCCPFGQVGRQSQCGHRRMTCGARARVHIFAECAPGRDRHALRTQGQ